MRRKRTVTTGRTGTWGQHPPRSVIVHQTTINRPPALLTMVVLMLRVASGTAPLVLVIFLPARLPMPSNAAQYRLATQSLSGLRVWFLTRPTAALARPKTAVDAHPVGTAAGSAFISGSSVKSRFITFSAVRR